MSNEDSRAEVDELLRAQKAAAIALLEENRDLVEALRDALLEHEELLGDEILSVLETTTGSRPIQTPAP